MKSAPGFDSERKKRAEESTREEEKADSRFPKNRMKEIIHCDFCGSLAVKFAKRKDGKIVYCCEDCASFIDKEAKWVVGPVRQC